MTVRELHNQAMAALERGIQAEACGDRGIAAAAFQSAFEAENAALEEFLGANLPHPEPTRSVLARSAANLALRAGMPRKAEQLAAFGLAGAPPEPIAQELRQAFERANFYHHLKLHGRELLPHELQLTVTGPGVSYGMAPYSAISDRVLATEKLLVRGMERLRNRPFRLTGSADGEIRRAAEPYQQASYAGSFAVTLRFAAPQQLELALDGRGVTIETAVDDLLDGLQAIERDDEAELARLIPEPDYRANFVSVAEQILPDSKGITGASLAVQRNGSPRLVALRRAPRLHAATRSERPTQPRGRQRARVGAPERIETICGQLVDAHGKRNKVRIYVSENEHHDLWHSDEQDDVVGLNYKKTVLATYVVIGKRNELRHLVPAPDGT